MPAMAEVYHEIPGVAIDEIDAELRPARQTRARLDAEAIVRYGPLYRAGTLPPVKLMYDAGARTHWVVDGAHTITAAKGLGCKDIRALVKPGTFLDAFREATRCNREHGVPIREADKSHAVAEFLQSVPGAKDMPQQQVADICDVCQQLVSQVKATLTSTSKSSSGCNGVSLTPREQQVEDYYQAHPDASVTEVAMATGIGPGTVVKSRAKTGRTRVRNDPPATVPVRAFLPTLAWDEVRDWLEAKIATWPRDDWAEFIVFCRLWCDDKAAAIGLRSLEGQGVHEIQA